VLPNPLPDGDTSSESPWILTLYKERPGVLEGSTSSFDDFLVHNLSKSDKSSILIALNGHSSDIYALRSIPEESLASPDALPLPEDLLDDDPHGNDEPDSDEDDPPPIANYEPTASQLRDLKVAHENTGHPKNADFAKLLRRGNWKAEIAGWVRQNFKCEACEADQMPKARRPTAIPRSNLDSILWSS
jgi:hypothetical protein